MAFKAAVASGLVLASAEHVKLTYSDCGSSSTHTKVTGLKPDAIDVPGKAAIVGSGSLDSDQTSAHFSLKVTKAGIPFFSGKGNICEDTSFKLPLGTGSFTVKGLDCPVKEGNLEVEVDLDILSELFEDGENSLLSIHIDANADDTGDQVICLDVDASLAMSEPELESSCCSCISGGGGVACAARCSGSACKTCLTTGGGKGCGARCGCASSSSPSYASWTPETGLAEQWAGMCCYGPGQCKSTQHCDFTQTGCGLGGGRCEDGMSCLSGQFQSEEFCPSYCEWKVQPVPGTAGIGECVPAGLSVSEGDVAV